MREPWEANHALNQKYSWRITSSRKEIGNEHGSGQCLEKGKAEKFEEQARANTRTSEQETTLKLRHCLPEAGKRMISFLLGLE